MSSKERTENIKFYGTTSYCSRRTDDTWVDYHVHFDISFIRVDKKDLVKVIVSEKIDDSDRMYLKGQSSSSTNEMLFNLNAFKQKRKFILDTILESLQNLNSPNFNKSLKPFFADSPDLDIQRIETIKSYRKEIFKVSDRQTWDYKSHEVTYNTDFNLIFDINNNLVTVILSKIVDLSDRRYVRPHEVSTEREYIFQADAFEENRKFILDTLSNNRYPPYKINELTPYLADVASQKSDKDNSFSSKKFTPKDDPGLYSLDDIAELYGGWDAMPGDFMT